MDSTHINCFAILEEIRFGIQEHSDALVRGQQPGLHSNEWLIKKINGAQAFIYSIMRKRMPGFFVDRVDITGVDSVFTLPSDYGSLIVFKDDQLRQVLPVDYDHLKRRNQTGHERRYYKKGATLVLDKDGVDKTYELWYFKRPRKMHIGKVDTGGTGTFVADKAARRQDDYYNGAIVESIDGDWDDVIADYTAARVVTLTDNTQAVAKGEYYGLVPEIPDFVHHLIAPRALLEIRSTSPTVKSGPPPRTAVDLFREDLLTVMRDFQDTEPDVDWEQVFGDFAPRQQFFGIMAE